MVLLNAGCHMYICCFYHFVSIISVTLPGFTYLYLRSFRTQRAVYLLLIFLPLIEGSFSWLYLFFGPP